MCVDLVVSIYARVRVCVCRAPLDVGCWHGGSLEGVDKSVRLNRQKKRKRKEWKTRGGILQSVTRLKAK